MTQTLTVFDDLLEEEAINDIERFTEGDCWILALEIHRLTGWQIQAFHWGDGLPDWHVWVQTPQGLCLDIEGRRSEKELMVKHGMENVVNCTPTDFSGGEDDWPNIFGIDSFQRAQEIAPQLIV